LRFLPLIILFFVFDAGIWAQTNEFSPYITRINVEARLNLIRITWVDSPDARGPVYIFRSARPFSGSIPANIRPVTVNYGEQYYIDDADDMENLYYFIAASDLQGHRYDIILPRVNSASLIPGLDEEESSFVVINPFTLTPVESIDGIYNLKANFERDRVVISFDSSRPRANAILYRSIQPVQRPQDLLNAVIVQSRIVSPFTDFPVPGLSWYYAIIYEDEIASGNMRIRPGINATVSAVTIYGDDNQERSLRPIPLPILSLRETIFDGFFIAEIPGQIALSAQASEMLANTRMPDKAPLQLKNPRVFSIDLTYPISGEDSSLFQIVTEQFLRFEWETARVNLQNYLSLPRSREIEARARFYLGQALYYTASYREALMEFLAFRSQYPDEAGKWIEAILTAMVY